MQDTYEQAEVLLNDAIEDLSFDGDFSSDEDGASETQIALREKCRQFIEKFDLTLAMQKVSV